MAPPIHGAQHERVLSQPAPNEAPKRDQRCIHDQDQPQTRSADDEERHIHADVVSPVGQRQECDCGDALCRDARPVRVGSARLPQAPDSYREWQHSQKMNPAMGYCQSKPGADQADADDGRKPNILTCHDAPSRNPPGKEQSQEKGIIDIRGRESCYARGQHPEISIHQGLRLCSPSTWRQNEII